MPGNPWVAIDASTPLSQRARELRRVWDEFVGNGRFDGARAPIAQSWQRSAAAGIDPAASRAPTVAESSDIALQWQAHPLETTAPLIRKWLGAFADESDHLIVVSDADGLLLWLDGNARVRSQAADGMNFVEGALWSEPGAGTNAIGTALATDHPVQVHAAEHLSEVVHAWTCSAAPVHDPESGQLLGIIDLTGLMRTAHPHSLDVAVATARAVEADLRARMQARDERLRALYLARSGSSRNPLALVSAAGRVIADHPDGLVGVERLEVPAGGGELILPSGERAVAELVGDQEAFIVRAVRATHATHESRGETAWRRAQSELSRLAMEQAALRRVATLVAGHTAGAEIFEQVAEEVGRILDADRSVVNRYGGDGAITVQADWSTVPTPAGAQIALDNAAAAIRESGAPIRFDGSTVGAPIIVDGRVWGAILVHSRKSDGLPEDAESRIVAFTELAATAISNAVAREELAASRLRLVTTADETRRRIERNLHDGLQQRLVSLLLTVRTVNEPAATREALLAEVSRIELELESLLDELHEVSHGIHPPILSKSGLEPALKALARRSALPVEVEVELDGRLPEPVEVAAYYVVSEALTNAAKHANASLARVAVERRNGGIRVVIRDDGAGGADPERGSGLVGLRDRVEAIGGTIAVDSPPGRGTSLLVALPVHNSD